MKKCLITSLVLLTLTTFLSFHVQGQVIITSIPDSTAVMNEVYSYDVNVATTPPGAAVTFSLEESPSGMNINPTTGVITWSPASIYVGSKVVVKATKSVSEIATQIYYIYVTNEIECPDDLVSYWSFDSKTGTTVLDMANDYDAEFVGVETNEPALAVNGVVEKAAIFDPQSPNAEFYEVPDIDNQYDWKYNDNATIALWFKNKPTGLTPTAETLIARGPSDGNPSSWCLQWVNTNSQLGFYIRSGNQYDTIAWKNTAITDTSWHHVAVTLAFSQNEVSEMYVYLDGYKTATSFQFGPDGDVVTKFDNITPVTIGHWNQYAPVTYPFSGKMDEVAIFNTALTGTRVNELYDKGYDGIPVCQEGNFTPIITSTAITSATEDVQYSYTLKARDIESSSLTKSVVKKPKWLSFNTSTGLLSGTPTNSNVGDTIVTLRVSDGIVSVDQTFTITVANVNDDPQITSTPSANVDEDVAYSYTLTATDIDVGDVVTLSATVLPGWLTFNQSSGLLSGTPSNDQVGYDATKAYNVTLLAADNHGGSKEQSFTITVHNINDPPEITSTPTLTATVDELYTYTVVATDVDNEELTFMSSTVPPWLTFNTTSHILSGIPATANIGNNSVSLAVYDGDDLATQSFTIAVTPKSAIDDRTAAFAIVYPVPASGFVTFEFPGRLGKATLEVFTVDGSMVKKLDVSGSSTYKLDITDLKSGQYLYRIMTNEKLQNGAIIVE